ncbi:uncharacterized protein FOBCDRAFT_37821 [Fusarium oxysporum Fo47]|uniref:uncharacterized protein n=1 Tax=Fusarium oxysporum Fo47 TaxID=660027 RepID=UPI002869EA24|nr:uncharacterized protein FOBCDRAFT_37821 [Fusarium oxysporum Fo47]QKD54921.2 hypothetical protein FOBCDRAFT_37821 [Fusarium oxysporum Fo47]
MGLRCILGPKTNSPKFPAIQKARTKKDLLVHPSKHRMLLRRLHRFLQAARFLRRPQETKHQVPKTKAHLSGWRILNLHRTHDSLRETCQGETLRKRSKIMTNLVVAMVMAMVMAMVIVITTTTKRMIMNHPTWQKRGPVPAGSHCGQVASEVAAAHALSRPSIGVYVRLTV